MLRKILVVLCLMVLSVGCALAMEGWTPINETTPGYSAAPDAYEATHVKVPVGPYSIDFDLRAENATYSMAPSNTRWNMTSGSGKDYHTCTYETESFLIEVFGPDYDNILVEIYHYVGPTAYPPENPDPLGYKKVPMSVPHRVTYDTGDVTSIDIDGKKGTQMQVYLSYEDYNIPTRARDIIVAYQPDANTFVVIEAGGDLDYDKITSLFLETLHIKRA
jgi:hypothetical protein